MNAGWPPLSLTGELPALLFVLPTGKLVQDSWYSYNKLPENKVYY